jgi:hypothetical protein
MARKKSAVQLDREISQALYGARGARQIFSPHTPTAGTRAAQQEKLEPLKRRFPKGAYVKIVGVGSYVGHVGKVAGYSAGAEYDEPMVKVRFLSPVKKIGAVEVDLPQADFYDDEIEVVEDHATKKAAWTVVVEDGYVKVKRDGETIAAGVDTGGRRLTGVEFTRPEYQRSNPTRQKAMRTLQAKGYR